MAESSTRILLLRHGTNDCVRDGRLAGRAPGVHLNQEGKAQADALACRLADRGVTAIYSSPLERAMETASALAALLGLQVRVLREVIESDVGEWTGGLMAELSKSDLWTRVQAQPGHARFPSGESLPEIQARMVAALESVRDAHPGETVAVFSHSDPIKLAVAFCIGVPIDLFQRLVVAPASITELEFTSTRPFLLRLNDCAHIVSLAAGSGTESPSTAETACAPQLV